MINEPNTTKSVTLTVEQWNLINHALGIAANVVADKRGCDAAEKYDTLSDHLTYDLDIFSDKEEEPEPEPFVWDAEHWLDSLTKEEYQKFLAEAFPTGAWGTGD